MAEKKAKPAEGEVFVEEAVKEAPKPKLCGHLNMHHKGLKGKLEPLACTQLAGHSGDHSAPYQCLRQVEDNFETAELRASGVKMYELGTGGNKKLWAELTEIGYWSDGAGVLAADIFPDLEQLAALKKSKSAAIVP